MRTCARFVSQTLLCGLVLACLSPIWMAAAAPVASGQDDREQASNGHKRVEGGQVRPEWKLDAPISSGNLTVFPVTSDDWPSTGEFITLDEGLKSGGVTITELGGIRRVRGRGQSDNAEVNTLSLTNKTGKTLILLAGELLVGGKQDRIVDHDRLVPSDDAPIALGVFCVEHGRWQGSTAAFGHNQTAVRPPGGARNFVAGGTGAGAGGPLGGQIANPAVREKAEAKKSQSEVWSKVGETTEVVNATSASGALTRAYQDGKVAMRTGPYIRDLKDKCAGKNVVGVVVAVNGEAVNSDIFASPSLFRRYWPKLLESYALEAISAGKPVRQGVDRQDAQTFLSRVEGNISSEGEDGVYRLMEHKSAGESSFELEYIAAAAPLLVHFNRIAAR
jgi:hypothetical protein